MNNGEFLDRRSPDLFIEGRIQGTDSQQWDEFEQHLAPGMAPVSQETQQSDTSGFAGSI
ncbi:hypothetical protein [Desulforhabdus sp. TSK]|uniref:hypothetical protein n=1 Tax=Desulforhabdus sp. TSK TaxID=2925014 RepID=UPI001FC7E44D|nr:hypothetical protein [Desulforhabdus sp. TSK]GKT07447.1 hypothetical protein DSTSK_07520 [Desulforhabdus sp. TSK]